MNDLTFQVRNNLKHICRVLPERPIVVGVSGGPDSMCLLDILLKSGYTLVVAHFDHQFRPSSAAEAEFVRHHAAAHGLRCIDAVLDVPDFAAKSNLSLEEAARRLRYKFLFETASEVSAQAVAVGHTADDQVETVLMHMIQGAGLRGLRGMVYRGTLESFSQEIPIVRPLLSVWRADIVAYCTINGLETIEDPSNLDQDFTRNRVRRTLIPMLETFNPRIREAVWRMSQVLAGELAINREALDRVWGQFLQAAGPGFQVFRRTVWVELGEGYQRGLLRRALEDIDPAGRSQGQGFSGVEDARDFINLPENLRREKRLGEIRLVCEADEIWLLAPGVVVPGDDFPGLPPGEPQVVQVPGLIDLPDGWRFRAKRVEDLKVARIQANSSRDPFQAWVDAGILDNRALFLRTRRPGDRLKPLGLDGRSQKLSDFMINVKMPQRARERWPLVVVGNELVWVPGYRLGHPFRLTNQTEEAVYLTLQKVSLGDG